MPNIKSLAAIVLFLLAAVQTPADEPDSAHKIETLRSLSKSVVTVEYHLRYDRGDPPRGAGYHVPGPTGGSTFVEYGQQLIHEDRPMEVYSYLIADDLVISEEVPLHERFISSITVRFGDAVVTATPVGWAMNRHGVYLKLGKTLEGAVPMTFDASLPGPYTGMVAGVMFGSPTMHITPFSVEPMTSDDLGERLVTPSEAIAVDAKGRTVGMSMSTSLAIDDTWKGSPADWPKLSLTDRDEMLAQTEQITQAGILRVRLNLRSPSQRDAASANNRYQQQNPDQFATEIDTVGVMLDGGRLLVLADLETDVTARLERITAYTEAGQPLDAKFVATLKDYGGLIAQCIEPVSDFVTLSDQPIFDAFSMLLPHANVEVRGEERLAYFGHRRIHNFERGWRNHAFPATADADYGDTFLFNHAGMLIALPITRREPVAAEGSWTAGQPLLTPTVYLHEALTDLFDHSDPNNVPLSEEDENRLAWIGVVLQPLNRDLARINRVAELTQDGNTGALVNYVYPGSPAAEAGIEPGAILLRLHIPTRPQPIDIQVDERSSGFPMPWERYDELPEAYYDQLPQPWPNADNALTQNLTKLGFDTAFAIEWVADGQMQRKDFAVQQSPPHYNSASRFEQPALGLTVKNITYEVRRYFQLADDAPGVIISKLEPGSRASIAGMKPYEMVTHINDKPIHNVDDFEAALQDASELRFTLKRVTQTRQVRIAG